MPSFKGECIGVRLDPRASEPNDNHILVTIMTEDDGQWFDKEVVFSSAWLEEAIQVLQAAKDWIDRNAEPEFIHEGKTKCGYRFKG